MGKEGFGGRRNELEERFFREKDAELIRAMREKTAKMERKKALSDASGIEHEELLDELVRLEISSETLAALSLVPLVAVAWADGELHDKERAAIVASAEKAGLDEDHAGHDLLEAWLKQKPDKSLIGTWRDYTSALCEVLTPEAKAELYEDLLDHARSVAAAAGGILGLGSKISKPEQAVLDELAKAFD